MSRMMMQVLKSPSGLLETTDEISIEKKVPSLRRARSSPWALPERCRAAIRTAEARIGRIDQTPPALLQNLFPGSARNPAGRRIRVDDGAVRCGQHQTVETILKSQTVKGLARGHARGGTSGEDVIRFWILRLSGFAMPEPRERRAESERNSSDKVSLLQPKDRRLDVYQSCY
jgi:hypothetical protein